MATLKKSLAEMEDSDNEEPTMGKQILPVARLPDNFDGEPEDGLQYLFTVRRDARKLPHVTRVANPFELAVPKVEEKPIDPSAVRVELPSEEWRAVFLKRFRNFRKNLSQASIGVALPSSSGSSRLMPEKKERDKWWAFINGRPECEWNPPKKPKKTRQEWSGYYDHDNRNGGMHGWNATSSFDGVSQYEVRYTEEEDEPVHEAYVVNEYGEVALEGAGDPSGSPPAPSATTQLDSSLEQREERARHDRTHGPRQPTPALLKPLDTRYCTHLLMYFTHWITQHLAQLASPQPLPFNYARLTQTHARWMFALLACVDVHVSGDEMSSLRSLARACLAFIKDLSKDQALTLGVGDRPPDAGGQAETVSADVLIASCKQAKWLGDPADAPLDERACWIVVAAITEFWGQKDLWMDADSILNGSG